MKNLVFFSITIYLLNISFALGYYYEKGKVKDYDSFPLKGNVLMMFVF